MISATGGGRLHETTKILFQVPKWAVGLGCSAAACQDACKRACESSHTCPFALLQRRRCIALSIPHNRHEPTYRRTTTRREEGAEGGGCVQQRATPAPRIHRRAFGASRVLSCFQNQRASFRSCGASQCRIEPSAGLDSVNRQHWSFAVACCCVQRSCVCRACAEADSFSK